MRSLRIQRFVAPGSLSYATCGFTLLGNGKALFQANDAALGMEFWVTDGTAAGTSLVKDIWNGVGFSFPNGITAIGNGRALFQATNGIAGNELWVLDSTPWAPRCSRISAAAAAVRRLSDSAPWRMAGWCFRPKTPPAALSCG
jgi:ELWxxDGT repeat protein